MLSCPVVRIVYGIGLALSHVLESRFHCIKLTMYNVGEDDLFVMPCRFVFRNIGMPIFDL